LLMSLNDIVRSQAIGFGLAVFGALGVLYGFYAGESAKQYGLIRYKLVSQITYEPIFIKNFNETVASPKIDNTKKLFVSEITLWNAGNQSFEPRDIRSPVEITGDSTFNIIDAVIINSKSATDNNFNISSKNNTKIMLDWKIFDPEEGFKIAILHNGDPEAVSVTGKFGPGRSIGVTPPHPYLPIITIFFGFAMLLLYFKFIGNKAISWSEKRFSGFQNFIAFMTIFVTGLLFAGAVAFGALAFIIYYNGEVAPINDKMETRIGNGVTTHF